MQSGGAIGDCPGISYARRQIIMCGYLLPSLVNIMIIMGSYFSLRFECDERLFLVKKYDTIN